MITRFNMGRARSGPILASKDMEAMSNQNWKRWTGIIAAVCGAELVVAAAIGGAGIGVFFGLEGAFVAALVAATLALSVRSWLAARRRSRPTGSPLLIARVPAQWKD